MKVKLNHLQLNVSDKEASFTFYRDLLSYLGFSIVYEDESTIGFENDGFDIWLNVTEDKRLPNKFHRKNTGLNHLAFSVDSKEDVDKFSADFLNARGISTLYNTPKPFPEYSENYYAVFFEDPDRMKLEVVAM